MISVSGLVDSASHGEILSNHIYKSKCISVTRLEAAKGNGLLILNKIVLNVEYKILRKCRHC